MGEFHRLAQSDGLESVAKAKQAMDIINSISDPELTELAPQVTSALIDGEDTPDFSFELAQSLDDERLKARDMLFSGDVERAIESAQSTLERMDRIFAENPGVPRYFNSYAERVIYNRMFARIECVSRHRGHSLPRVGAGLGGRHGRQQKTDVYQLH